MATITRKKDLGTWVIKAPMAAGAAEGEAAVAAGACSRDIRRKADIELRTISSHRWMRENPGCHRGFCSVVALRMSPPPAIVDAVREFVGRMLRWAGCEVSGAARHFSAAPGRVTMKRSG